MLSCNLFFEMAGPHKYMRTGPPTRKVPTFCGGITVCFCFPHSRTQVFLGILRLKAAALPLPSLLHSSTVHTHFPAYATALRPFFQGHCPCPTFRYCTWLLVACALSLSLSLFISLRGRTDLLPFPHQRGHFMLPSSAGHRSISPI